MRTTHTANGLFDRVRASEKEEDEIQQELINFTTEHFKDEPAVLAGNSIHQDRRFIRQWMPDFDTSLHYRMLDVSSFKLVVMNRYGLQMEKAENHRAIDDIRQSIAELKYCLEVLRSATA